MQEEPENLGAWPFLRTRLPACLPDGAALECVARPESASPAVGSKARHDGEQAELMGRALGR